MEDQPKSALNKFYKESLKKAQKHLEEKYSAVKIDENDEDFPDIDNRENYTFLKVHIVNEKLLITLVVAVHKHFPDKLPKIYLSKKDYLDLAPIPHVDNKRFVCTKDPNVVFLNDKKPAEAVDELIRVAINILNKGIRKENIRDFTEEFLAYWNEQAKYKFLSLWAPSAKIELVNMACLVKKLNISKYLISASIEEAKKWLSPLEIQIDENRIYDALYLPLSSPIQAPLPQTNGEIYKVIKNSGKKNCRTLEDYLNKSDSKRVILFSFPLKSERILAGWMFSPWKREIYNGFRTQTLPLDIRMAKSANIPIEKITIERIDRKR